MPEQDVGNQKGNQLSRRVKTVLRRKAKGRTNDEGRWKGRQAAMEEHTTSGG